MGTAKHTPGPWVVEREYEQFVVVGPRKGCKRNSEENTWELARVGDGVFWDDPKFKAEDLANAHLIAAAPDMLAALKLAFQHGTISDSESRMNIVAAAINKAEGRA